MSAAGRMVPGVSEALLEQEPVSRYRFACGSARGRDVLDAACGVGYSAPMFLEAGARSYLGIDINADAVELATKNYRTSPATWFVVDDACEFRRVPERSFDLVVFFETIEHVASGCNLQCEASMNFRPQPVVNRCGGSFL